MSDEVAKSRQNNDHNMEEKWREVNTIVEENVSIEEQLMEQPRNYELTERKKSLRERTVTQISQNTE